MGPTRSLLILAPASLAATALAGVGLCVGLGHPPHGLTVALAAAAVLVACVAGAVPLLLSVNPTQLAMTQAALIGTMLHLFFAAIAAAVVVLARVLPPTPFLYWLLVFYWATLAALVAGYAKAIRAAAPVTPAAPPPSKA